MRDIYHRLLRGRFISLSEGGALTGDAQRRRTTVTEKKLHQPGVEPGARPWEDPMLPLHH